MAKASRAGAAVAGAVFPVRRPAACKSPAVAAKVQHSAFRRYYRRRLRASSRMTTMASAARTAVVSRSSSYCSAAAARGDNPVIIVPDQFRIAAVTALSARSANTIDSAFAAGPNLYAYRAGLIPISTGLHVKRGMIDKPSRAAAAPTTIAPGAHAFTAAAAARHDQNLYGGRTSKLAVERESVRLLTAQRGILLRHEGMDFVDRIIYGLYCYFAALGVRTIEADSRGRAQIAGGITGVDGKGITVPSVRLAGQE